MALARLPRKRTEAILVLQLRKEATHRLKEDYSSLKTQLKASDLQTE